MDLAQAKRISDSDRFNPTPRSNSVLHYIHIAEAPGNSVILFRRNLIAPAPKSQLCRKRLSIYLPEQGDAGEADAHGLSHACGSGGDDAGISELASEVKVDTQRRRSTLRLRHTANFATPLSGVAHQTKFRKTIDCHP